MDPSLSRRQVLRVSAGLVPAAIAMRAVGQAPAGAAQDVLRRWIGQRAVDFDFRLDSSPAERPWYRVTSRRGAVSVAGSDPVALTRGIYAYLKTIGAAAMSWEGDRIALPQRFPDYDSGPVETPFGHRAYLNPCTYGYTTPWWDWPRWEREIDWMALHGIDMPLALEGQEHVWQTLWREAGLSDDDLAGHFSAAPFTPWQRMGNIAGYDAPLSQSWIDRKRALQEKLLARMRALGMKPVLPAFAGYVPQAFATRHPTAKIYQMRPWEGFAGTWWLDPLDPLFAQLSARFLALYAAVYGDGSYYLADSFNETLPPLTADGAELRQAAYGDATAHEAAAAAASVTPEQRDARLAAYGQALCQSIRQSRPDATWVMQGWLFGADQHFWTSDAIAAFLSRVPDAALLVLDIGNDRYSEVWRSAQAYHGKGWIYGYVHNYGGSNPLYGDLDYYRRDLGALLTRADTGHLAGFGVFPEGLYGLSVVYEYLFDLAWGSLDQTLADWLATYLTARYGSVSPAVLDAWNNLIAACLRTRYWTSRWWRGEAGAYLLFKRPSSAMADFEGHPGDHALLRRAARQLADLSPTYPAGSLFQHDLAEVVRHLASLDIDLLLQQTLIAYREGDLAAADRHRQRVAGLVDAVDDLAGSQPESLARWIGDARAYATNAADARDYQRQAKTQITLWGGSGNLHDYASKAWQGLYRDFYLPRWTIFFDARQQSAISGAVFDEAAVIGRIAGWERDWTMRDLSDRRRSGVPSGTAAAMLLDRLDRI